MRVRESVAQQNRIRALISERSILGIGGSPPSLHNTRLPSYRHIHTDTHIYVVWFGLVMLSTVMRYMYTRALNSFALNDVLWTIEWPLINSDWILLDMILVFDLIMRIPTPGGRNKKPQLYCVIYLEVNRWVMDLANGSNGLWMNQLELFEYAQRWAKRAKRQT